MARAKPSDFVQYDETPWRRVIGMLLVVLVTFNFTAFASTSDAAKIKGEITKRGTGEKARVRITTRDKVELKGYISELGDQTFTLTRKRPAEKTTLLYSDVVKVRGPGLSTTSKTAIGIAVFVGVGTGIAAAIILPRCGSYC